uniref:Globin family profile domain-containing protein n=1 Tax=Acrobeloides nanus TaxID=290746 RepID=A0A914ELB0_9BILA
MFCCGSLSPELIRRQVDNTSWEPSEYEIMLIKATWSDNEDDLTKLGASIYVYIFENYPEVKHFFPKIHQHGENWKESKEFHMQGYFFAQTLSRVVDNIAQTDLVKPFLYKIGARHVSYSKLYGFRPHYWDLFQEAMAHVISGKVRTTQDYLDNTQKNDAVAVWKRLAIFIVDNLKAGYDETRFMGSK